MIVLSKNIKEELLDLVYPRHRPLVVEAIKLASKYLKDKRRRSGVSWLEHCVRVAINVADVGLDTDTVLASILHHNFRASAHEGIDRDRVEEEIKEKFGEEVLELLHKFEVIAGMTKSSGEFLVINRYLLKSATDLRVLIVRLSDRLESARTIEALSEENQKILAEKLLKIYAPLANYMNLIKWKGEIENWAYKSIYPQGYIQIDKEMSLMGLKDERILNEIDNFLTEVASDYSDDPIVFGRIKSYYSVHLKLKKYAEESKPAKMSVFDDLLAFTIIVSNVDECYLVSSALREYLEDNVLLCEDYISNPKPNGFKQLQLSIKIPEMFKGTIEVQIMTMEMYHCNVYGTASHFAYKEQGTRYAKPSTEFNWIKEIRDKMDKSLNIDRSERSRPMLSNLFQENVFVWTPDKEIIQLPKGAMPLDFAYRIHTEIGNRVVYVEVNNEKVPLSYELKSGDVVNVITHKNKSVVSTVHKEWMDLVVTDYARDKLKAALHKKGVKV